MFATARNVVGLCGFGFGLALLLLGSIVSFTPGSESKWLAGAACVAACGLLSPNVRVRLAALAVLGTSGIFAWLAYVQTG